VGEIVDPSQNQHAFTVFNSTGRRRTAICQLPIGDEEPSRSFVDSTGRSLLSQSVENVLWVQCEEVPAMGWTTIHGRTSSEVLAETPFAVGPGRVETPFYVLQWNDHGQWTELYDRRVGRQVLVPGTLGNLLQVFEDKPLNFDAWDIDIFYQEKMTVIDRLESVRTVSVGPLAAVVRFTWTYADSRVEQDVTFYRSNPRIDCVTRVDWHERQQLLKVAFAVDVRATEATYDIQFGNLKRPTHWNTSWDMAKFEVVGHQWADLSEAGYGVSLANDCKYGYDIHDQVMRLSLIKSAISPDYQADQGEHRFTYSLIPHAGSWIQGEAADLAWDLNSPLRAVAGEGIRDRFSLLEVDSAEVRIDAVKCAEDSQTAVVRVHEYGGGRHSVSMSSDVEIRTWTECDLMERPLADRASSGPLAFELRPYEIKTFLVDFGRG
jgi:alpha-mannosidase